MCIRDRMACLTFACVTMVCFLAATARGQDTAAAAEVRKNAESLMSAFNAGKADAVTAMFLPKGELIDEEGTIYQGQQEIKNLLTAFFERFPGSKLSLNIESIRLVGPIAIEEGVRTITTKDGALKSHFRYLAIWTKADRGWQLVSFRDFADNETPTAHDHLQSVAWLVGDWINEGADGKVSITYRWSEDKNYLLGEYQFSAPDGSSKKSSQRIGWNAATGKIRSWLFDADGGFAEGDWTLVEDGVVIKSSSVNPDGSTATATVTITPDGKDRFTIDGTDRVVGDNLEDDFEITVVRRPPAAAK